MRSRLTALVLSLGLLLAGCTTFQREIAQLSGAEAAKEREIAALRVEFGQKLDAKVKELDSARQTQLGALDAQLSAAANAFYAQDVLFRSIPSPVRNEIVMHMLGDEGWAALGRRVPTYETMQRIAERLKNDLDETKTSLADLQREHQQAVQEGAKVADAAKAAEANVQRLEREKQALTSDFQAKLTAMETERADLANQLAAAEHQRSNEAAARQAQIAKLSWGAGILAALCLAGAIFSPVFKGELGIAAAGFGAAAVFIPFVEGWWILAALGVLFVGAVVRAVLKHSKEDRANDALALTIQDLKDKGGDIAKHVESALADRLARYKRAKDGSVITVPDQSLQRHIEDKIAAYDALPVPAQQSTVLTPPAA